MLGAAASLVAVLIGWGEWANWRASHADLPQQQAARGAARDAVIVLGYPSTKHGTAHWVQKWRVRIAARTIDARSSDTTVIFTGAAGTGRIPGDRSEAAVMAEYAVAVLGVRREQVVLEERATTTWENIGYCIPLVEDADTIAIASNPFHARKARRYLAEQAPHLARRLRRAADYRFGELAPVKPLLAIARK